MKTRGILILSLCLGLLVGLAVYDHFRESKVEQNRLSHSRLLDFDVNQVSAFEVENPSERIILERKDGQWHMVSPFQEESDQVDIQQTLMTILSERIIDIAKEGEGIDWSLYGLDKPSGTLTLSYSQGHKMQLAIGSIPNFEGDLYLRRNDEKRVLVVQPSFAQHVSLKAQELRDRRVFKAQPADIKAIAITNKSGALQLQFKDDLWVSSQESVVLEQNLVRELVTKIAGLRAEGFLDKSLNAKEKVMEIELQLKDQNWKLSTKRSKDRRIMGTVQGDQRIYLMDEGLVAYFEDLTLESLKKKEAQESLQKPAEERANEN